MFPLVHSPVGVVAGRSVDMLADIPAPAIERTASYLVHHHVGMLQGSYLHNQTIESSYNTLMGYQNTQVQHLS